MKFKVGDQVRYQQTQELGYLNQQGSVGVVTEITRGRLFNLLYRVEFTRESECVTLPCYEEELEYAV